MALLLRRLRKRAFKDYASALEDYTGEPLPDEDAFDCWNAATGNLTVRGFDDDAKAALRAANCGGDAAAELEVPWCAMDRVSYIIQRIEEALRIPKAHWFLADERGPLKADSVACNSLAFVSPTPELTLVPKAAKDAFKQNLQSKTPDYTQTATALFGLIEPLASDDERAWKSYIKQRKLDVERLQETMAGLDDECEATRAMLEQIRGGTSDILSGTGLSIGQVLSAEAAITPQAVDVEDDEGDLQSVDITTRIYSLHQPGAVDVKIHFWHKARYYSVEWCVRVSYCVHETVPADRSDSERAWKHLLYCGLKDTNKSGNIERWNPREDKRFGLLGADVRRIQRVLFGDADVSLVDTVRLMLASVGIYIVFRVEFEGDAVLSEEKMRYDGNRDMFKWVQHTTKYSLFDARWLGVQIRRVGAVPLPSDSDYIDRAAKPRYRKGDFGEDSDDDDLQVDDDEDDEDSEGDSGDDEWY